MVRNAFKQEAIGAGVVKSGDLITIKFDVKGALTQPGAVFNVLLLEKWSCSLKFSTLLLVTNAWTTLRHLHSRHFN
jgi:hypothetical protein